MARGADARRAQIVEFWRTVEMFSPQRVERVSRDRLVFGVGPGQPLPWNPHHELARRRLRPDQTWRHVVYLGIYRLDAMFEVLSNRFAPDEDSYDERPPGESAIAAFTVGGDGLALADSPVLSSCAWATGRVLRKGRRGRDWLSEFGAGADDFAGAWWELVTDEILGGQDEEPRQVRRVLNGADLDECLAAAVAAAGIGSALPCAEIRISSQIIAKRNADRPDGRDFLNSFIMADLARVKQRTATGDIGAALRAYLRPEAEIPTAERVDVRALVELSSTDPSAVPAGRWPSNPEHALALNQQLAVSSAIRMTDTAVLGVNGPPGTGKTTMLRDLIAAVVVGRAERLAALSDPAKAFTAAKFSWSTGQRTRVVSEWRPELTGFEMVVASTNNGAVQNVTDEIPAADAIDDTWRTRAATVDYFPEIAGALLAPESVADGHPAATSSTGPQAWALVAARLGNKANRGRFVNTFWYHDPEAEAGDRPWSGLLAVLKSYEQTVPTEPWSAAVEAFRASQARVAALRTERSEVYQAIERRARIRSQQAGVRQSVVAAAERVRVGHQRHEAALRVEREQLANAELAAQARRTESEQTVRECAAEVERLRRGRKADAERVVRSWEAEASRRWQIHAEHQRSRPGLWQQLRTVGATGQQWSRQDSWLADEVRDARSELSAAQRDVAAAQHEVDAAQRRATAAQRELDAAQRAVTVGVDAAEFTFEPLTAARRQVARAEQGITTAVRAQAEREQAVRDREAELVALDDLLDQAGTRFGRHYPDPAWWRDRERRELAALWTDEPWNTARSELFLAALTLHKAFLQHAATQMRRNLQAAMDVVSGDAPGDLSAAAALSAWQSLFFVVPVVSTTFASYARLFGHLGKEALGWLLIDEAGQATPQNAVGALWRTKRAVVVGDPLQLEPITTLPFRAEQAIRNELGVDEQWSTSQTSVQRLADRLTPLGTWLPDGDGKTWVGVPLTVHRRCDRPMFDIVNTIAYDGLMIDGTGPAPGARFSTAYPTLPPSKWIDVADGEAQGHWIPAEGRQLDRILDTLAGLDFTMSDVMVIGPFRDVARQISHRARRHPGLVAGTVHTAQGKQADIVILVLGGAPDRPGSRRWAASKPNLVNVAVSRTKRRLYVIGNRQAWSSCRYFDVLAAKLPASAPVQPQERI